MGDRRARPRIVILGSGFAGLACARALGGKSADVTLVDRNNYHLFVPLLYQVATAALSPADIAEPIRKIVRRHRNIDVVLGEVVGIDVPARHVALAGGRRLAFDRLVLATGSAYNYFGHDAWAVHAPGLKTIDNARQIRTRILKGFELAELTDDPAKQAALMTTIVVGAGPTGVEVAGAVAELARYTLARDFRRIDPRRARVLLVEAGPRMLTAFPDDLVAYARQRLDRLGVEVMLDHKVEGIRAEGAVVEGHLIRAQTVIWGAGVRASPAAQWLGVEADRAGRIPVTPDLSVPGLPGIYVLGDTASTPDAHGQPLPGLAQVAEQQGQHLGKALAREIETGAPLPPFQFRNRGNTAIIGRNAAIFDFGRGRHLRGFAAWLLWAIVHVYLLVAFDKRLIVTFQWLWRYLTYQRGARLITGDGAGEGTP
ncbi:pyridine nucleotide-disulfide oxidoreductase [Sphingomonas metalli]|uniref:Pyridine nucleotide-disulfide oxidoreductase n=1 Tax=Sphingomonas metalli TaxID=1779358 RepID=A0A916WUN1_9SPHN|nr:NAD(P)/FAD-dependent oxidoreductase [Sphingomonas metalli]GGB32135.1 pyridine nucleotide-disulfide oxidoreductase [Sphingomonas metalli]